MRRPELPRRPVAVLLVTLLACATVPKSERAWQALDSGDALRAERMFRDLLVDAPADLQLRNGLGAALAAQQRWVEACRLLRADSRPLSAGACWLAAAEEAAAQQRDAQLVRLGREADLDMFGRPEARAFLHLATAAARRLEAWDELLGMYPRLLAVDPGVPRTHYLYARALEQRERFDQALREYELALALAPDDDEIERYLRRLRVTIQRRGATSSARIEQFDAPASARRHAPDDGVRVQAWDGGVITATIQIEEQDGAGAPAGGHAAVEVLRSHWPSDAEPEAITAEIARLARELRCPGVYNGWIELTFGSEGSVSDFRGEGVPADCLRRQVRSWFLPAIRGGYLRVRLPVPYAH